MCHNFRPQEALGTQYSDHKITGLCCFSIQNLIHFCDLEMHILDPLIVPCDTLPACCICCACCAFTAWPQIAAYSYYCISYSFSCQSWCERAFIVWWLTCTGFEQLGFCAWLACSEDRQMKQWMMLMMFIFTGSNYSVIMSAIIDWPDSRPTVCLPKTLIQLLVILVMPTHTALVVISILPEIYLGKLLTYT